MLPRPERWRTWPAARPALGGQRGIRSGRDYRRANAELRSLGTLFYEPLWFFYRDVNLEHGMEGPRGKRISIGPEGSGTRALTLELLGRNGIDRGLAEFLPYPAQMAGEKLLGGEIQAAIMLTSWDAPIVQRLAAADDVQLLSFPRVYAYVALYPFLNKLVLPAGVGDMAKNRRPKMSSCSLKASRCAATCIPRSSICSSMPQPRSTVGQGSFKRQGSSRPRVDRSAAQRACASSTSRGGHSPALSPPLAAVSPASCWSCSSRSWCCIRAAAGAVLYGWHAAPDLPALRRALPRDRVGATCRGGEWEDLTARLDRLEERANHFRARWRLHMLYTLRDHMNRCGAAAEAVTRSAHLPTTSLPGTEPGTGDPAHQRPAQHADPYGGVVFGLLEGEVPMNRLMVKPMPVSTAMP